MIPLQRRLLASSRLSRLLSTRAFSSLRGKSHLSAQRGLTAALSGLLLAFSYMSIASDRSMLLDSAGPHSSSSSSSARAFSSSFGPNPLQQAKQPVRLLTDAAADARLRQNEESYTVNRDNGVLRYDVAQLPSNNPIEDDRSEQIVEVPLEDPVSKQPLRTDWAFWGVYDGHSGWYTSALLRDELIGRVVSELSEAYPKSLDNPDLRVVPSSGEVDAAIKKGFLKLDAEIVQTNIEQVLSGSAASKKELAAEKLMPALSGACALLSFYDSHSQTLKVAVTGDSRALLGSLNDKKQWTVESLTTDQTGSNKEEAARIKSEHPEEPGAVSRGRILGRLEPSRAFGDGKFKWLRETQEAIHKSFFSYPIPSNLKTPPYVTAEPVITTKKINPANNDFLVLATDGLFELLTNEEIAGLVIKWAEQKKIFKNRSAGGASAALSSFNIFKSADTLTYPKVTDISANKDALKPPYRENAHAAKQIILEDDNVSTHLIRNSLTLGTGKKDYGKMLLNIPSPLSRRYRDDLTVVVVFFGENGKVDETNQLRINFEATRGGAVKPKL